MNIEDIYERVVGELERDGPRKGLWAMAFAKTGGVETAARAYYIEARAQQLLVEAERAEAQRMVEELNGALAREHLEHRRKLGKLLTEIESTSAGEELRASCFAALELLGVTPEQRIDPRSGIQFELTSRRSKPVVLKSLDSLRLFVLQLGKKALGLNP